MSTERTPAQRESDRRWLNLIARTSAERCRKVLDFLRANPNSTSDEVFRATKCSVHNAVRFTKRFRHYKPDKHGHRPYVYSVDEVKMKMFQNNERRKR